MAAGGSRLAPLPAPRASGLALRERGKSRGHGHRRVLGGLAQLSPRHSESLVTARRSQPVAYTAEGP